VRACRLALIVVAALVWGSAASAQNFIYVAYQAIPGTRTGWPDIARLDYNARQRLSEDVQRRILPDVIRALGMQTMALETQIVPGGYMLKTDPSFVTRFPPAEEEAALRFAAALGYVLRQDSMLVFAVDATAGQSRTVRVRFAGECLTPQTAQLFFEQAARTNKGLGGGYTAFGCEMLFINLRDDKNAPYSGLNDTQFAAVLERAAIGFAPPASVIGEFRTRTVLIGSDWPGNNAGKLYIDRLTALPVEAVAPLDLMSYRFGDMLRQAVR
jgi:uncharacterized protein (UPF0297 family)